MSKFTLLAVALLLSVAPAAAQTSAPTIVEHIEKDGNIRIFQPAAMLPLLMPQRTAEPATVDNAETPTAQTARHGNATATRWGYRVQIFDDNNPRTARREAEERHSRVRQEFPALGAYLTFNSPYWRVKVGDFRTRAEAEATLAELRHAYPAMAAYMRIVRDKINIFD